MLVKGQVFLERLTRPTTSGTRISADPDSTYCRDVRTADAQSANGVGHTPRSLVTWHDALIAGTFVASILTARLGLHGACVVPYRGCSLFGSHASVRGFISLRGVLDADCRSGFGGSALARMGRDDRRGSHWCDYAASYGRRALGTFSESGKRRPWVASEPWLV